MSEVICVNVVCGWKVEVERKQMWERRRKFKWRKRPSHTQQAVAARRNTPALTLNSPLCPISKEENSVGANIAHLMLT